MIEGFLERQKKTQEIVDSLLKQGYHRVEPYNGTYFLSQKHKSVKREIIIHGNLGEEHSITVDEYYDLYEPPTE